MKKSGYPKRFEVVICKIAKIYPNSVFAQLIEYGKTGMIHVSEVASRWVVDIKEFVKENQIVVCKVMGVDKEKDQIQLSIKKVRKGESTAKLNEYKRERRSAKMLELAAKKLKKTLEDAMREIGDILVEEFGSIYKSFDIALKNPDLLKQKGVPEKWAKAIIEIAEKSRGDKVYQIQAKLKLISYESEGVNEIKKALGIKDGVEVKYISASNYLIVGTGKNTKEIRNKVEEAAKKAVKIIEKKDGEGSYEIFE